MNNSIIAAVSFDHSPLAGEIDRQIVAPCVDAYGLRIESRDLVLRLRNVQGPRSFIKSLDLPIKLVMRVKEEGEDGARAKFDINKLQITLNVKPKFVIDAHGVPHVPFSSLYFDSYRGSLIHEPVHAIDANTGKAERFLKQKATTHTKGLEKGTPEYKKAYHGSPTEIRAFIEEIIYILEQRGSRLLDAASQGDKHDTNRVSLFLKSEPEALITNAVENKLLPPKFTNFIENTTDGGRKELARRVRALQQSLRRRYSGALMVPAS
jgi:hypothetical protein